MIEDKSLLNEDLATDGDPNIAQTDQNLSVDGIFQQTKQQSLARQICGLAPLSGPSGGMFSIIRSGNNYNLIRKEVAVFPSQLKKTGVTREVIQDIKNQFSEDSDNIIGNLFRGISNELENEKLLTVLRDNSLDTGDLQLSDSLNAQTNIMELTQKIHEIILKMNQKYQRTYNAFVVLPATSLSAFMALNQFIGTNETSENGLFITQINKTKYFLNPDATDTYAYIGLIDADLGKCSLVFSPYQNEIFEIVDPESGEFVYFLCNRFAITVSALHKLNEEMLFKFNILL